jgi:hypothetical protein
MGFWSSLGKTLLEAAPYIAAPFTGGVSLLAAPLTSKATDAWVQHDVNNDIAQGIQPSGYDSALSKIGDVGSIAAGAYGGIAGLSGLSSLGNAGKVISMAAPLAGSTIGQSMVNSQKAQQPSGPTSVPSSTTPSSSTSSTGGLSPSPSLLNSISSMHSPTSGTAVGSAIPSGNMNYMSNMNPSGSSNTGIGPSSNMGYLDYSQNMTNPNLQNSLGLGNQAAQQSLRNRGIY